MILSKMIANDCNQVQNDLKNGIKCSLPSPLPSPSPLSYCGQVPKKIDTALKRSVAEGRRS